MSISSLVHELAFAALLAPQSPDPAAPQDAAPPRPNLVLITLDTLRADHLGCYGYARPTSPSIDALAAESLLFERCYATIPHTTPSHCSILTGVYPLEHGILACSFRANEKLQEQRAFAPTPQLRSYAQILADHGWHTGGFVTAATVKRITGLAAGFQAWSEPQGEVRPGAEALADALAWLEKAEEPFFLWVHFFDAHSPPRESNKQHLRELDVDDALRAHAAVLGIAVDAKGGGRPGPAAGSLRAFVQYDAGIRVIDDHVGRLRAALESRGAWPRTTVVLTGDHGEGLGQHGVYNHGPVWNEGLFVPFLVRAPGRKPERIPAIVSSIDVLATALDVTPGLPREEFLAQARGRSAASPDFEERPVFSMSPPRRGEFALTSSRFKYIHRGSGHHELFDLQNDPHETADVKRAHPDIARIFEEQLEATMKEQKLRHAYYSTGATAEKLSAEQLDQLQKELEALGYGGDGDGDK